MGVWYRRVGFVCVPGVLYLPARHVLSRRFLYMYFPLSRLVLDFCPWTIPSRSFCVCLYIHRDCLHKLWMLAPPPRCDRETRRRELRLVWRVWYSRFFPPVLFLLFYPSLVVVSFLTSFNSHDIPSPAIPVAATSKDVVPFDAVVFRQKIDRISKGWEHKNKMDGLSSWIFIFIFFILHYYLEYVSLSRNRKVGRRGEEEDARKKSRMEWRWKDTKKKYRYWARVTSSIICTDLGNLFLFVCFDSLPRPPFFKIIFHGYPNEPKAIGLMHNRYFVCSCLWNYSALRMECWECFDVESAGEKTSRTRISILELSSITRYVMSILFRSWMVTVDRFRDAQLYFGAHFDRLSTDGIFPPARETGCAAGSN